MVERTRRQIGVVELVVGVEVAQFDGHLGRRVGVDGVAVAGHRRRRRRRAETGASVGAQPPAALVVRARRPPRVGQFLQAKVFFLNSERIQFSFGARLGWNDDAQPEVLERISGTMGGGTHLKSFTEALDETVAGLAGRRQVGRALRAARRPVRVYRPTLKDSIKGPVLLKPQVRSNLSKSVNLRTITPGRYVLSHPRRSCEVR